MRRALVELQESPGSERARTELEQTVTRLSRVDTVVASVEPRRTYRVAHLAAPVFDQHGAVTLVLYLLGFSETLGGAEVERLGHQLLRVGVSVTRAAGGALPDDATFRA
jgi:DNA-binding IclR family transcriptional regulator